MKENGENRPSSLIKNIAGEEGKTPITNRTPGRVESRGTTCPSYTGNIQDDAGPDDN